MLAHTGISLNFSGGCRLAALGGLLVAAGLIASPAAAEPAARADSSATRAATAQTPDYSAYQRLLRDFLSVTSERGAPIETRFNYSDLKLSPDVTQRFMNTRDGLFRVSPARLAPRDRLAWAINSYNFLVIQLLTENLYDRPVKTNSKGKEYRVRKRFESVQQIVVDGTSFFDLPVVEIEGVAYSLNRFERTFVFGGFEPGPGNIPPPGFDPLAHFALVCAAKGCPPLMPRAYRPDSIEAALEFAVRNALASPRHLRWNDRTDGPEASTLFDWYARDFGGNDKIVDFVKRYCPDAMRLRIEAKHMRFMGLFIPWDWSLNHTPDSKSES